MSYLLDTNTCSLFLNGRSESIRRRMAETPGDALFVCSVVKAALFFGAHGSRRPEDTLARQNLFLSRFVSLPFDDVSAAHYGKIRAELKRRGTPIGPNDLLIASIALANGLTLVSSNVGEFERIEGLDVVDWH